MAFKKKFDELDRQRVVTEVEHQLGVKLSPSGRRKKSFVDENCTPFWVLGGCEEWHGIPHDMMAPERELVRDGTLVIAKIKGQSIKIYTGSLREFVHNADAFPTNRERDCHFNVVWRGAYATINELPDYKLYLMAEIDYSTEHKEHDRAVKDFGKALEKLTSEERKAVLLSL